MLPEWFVVGLGASGIVAVVIAVVFTVGTRLFPTATLETAYSSETRRKIEIREYLESIGERYAEDHPVEGQPVEFYLPERDVAVTFDARAFFRIDKSPTHPVLVEHEMPGIHLGDRLPFETPTVVIGRDRPVESAFAALELPPTADVSAVKEAYREKVKTVHPDHGGDREAFERIREAYTTAREHAD